MDKLSTSLYRSRWLITVVMAFFTNPATMAYEYDVDSDIVSQDCEFYINSFGDAHEGESGNRWLEAEIVVDGSLNNRNIAKLINVGTTVEYSVNKGNKKEEVIILGDKVRDFFFQVVPYKDYDSNSPDYRQIKQFNFFIDVMTMEGKVLRFWLNSQSLTFQSTFWGYDYRYVDRGNGSGITYTQYPSPIFDQKKRCH